MDKLLLTQLNLLTQKNCMEWYLFQWLGLVSLFV